MNQIPDLIRVVYLHEQIRSSIGPGLAALADPRYIAAHELMSKLSLALGTHLPALSNEELFELVAKYKDFPVHTSFSPLIAISC